MSNETDKNDDIQFLVDHLQEHPDSILFARLADAYLRMNHLDEAIQLCESGIKKHPYYVTGHLVLGKSYLAKKMFDQAEKEFKRVLLFDPKHLAAHKLYGDLMQEIGWENTCEMSYKKILQIDPLDEVARSRVGEYILQSEQDYVEEEDTEHPPSQKSNVDIDVDTLSPVSPTATDEALLFQENDTEAEQKLPTPTDFTQQPEPELDQEREEEFSSILDDIFKDEVVHEDPEPESNSLEVPELEDPDYLTEIQSTPEAFFHDQEPAEDEAKTEDLEAAFQSEPVDLPETDHARTPASPPRIDFSEPETPKEPPKPKTEKPVTRKKKPEGKIVTPTLGEIYAAQGQYTKAIDVFELLLKKHPDNESYAQKIEMLRKKLQETKNAPKN